MNDLVYNLPPRSEEECLKPELQGQLEIEVSYLSFITALWDSGKFSCGVDQGGDGKRSCGLSENLCDTAFKNNSVIEESAALQRIAGIGRERDDAPSSVEEPTANCVQVKIVWSGERKEDAAKLCISCEPQQRPKDCKIKSTKKNSRRARKHKHNFLQPTLGAKQDDNNNNKLRYRVSTTEALFLDYLRSGRPIHIIVTGRCASHCLAKPLGQARLRLPQVLLRKFAFNIAKGHNFEHKTKIYALYKESKTAPPKVGDLLAANLRQKSGEIQLHFKMLFAPSAAVAAVAAASASPLAGRHRVNSVLHDKKNLTSAPLQHHRSCHHHHHHHHSHMVSKAKAAEHVSIQGDKSKRLPTETKNEDIVEAMKKLDAKLIAYLAGETDISCKLSNCEQENQVNLNLESQNNGGVGGGDDISRGHGHGHLDDLSPATKLNVFKTIRGIKLEMEALTLQPEGTKCMKLIENELSPVFTVECQLSNELIKKVPRHDMYHIMQFESEKFHSLTQCTRFGQQAERTVQLGEDENGNADEMNMGRIYFTVWWREAGTCLNEMLGMGSLDLTDLYKASLLQQCKRIEIERRGRQLACLYFKITLQRDASKRDLFLPKQASCDSGDEHTAKSADKQKSAAEAQQQQAQQNQGASDRSLGIDKSLTEKDLAQNNNTTLQTDNFEDETTKIRLLKGLIYANEARHLEELKLQKQKILICRRFWHDEPIAARADESNKFNYQELFSVINDEKFLQRVEKQYLHLELWHRNSTDDGNGNRQSQVQPLGIVRIPLHQFYIAYRDAAITNHLCKGKLPVISIDAWAPILNCETGAKLGELKCLLAVGSEGQIKTLKETRGLNKAPEQNSSQNTSWALEESLQCLQPLQLASTSKGVSASSAGQRNVNTPNVSAKKTSDLLDMLQKALLSPPSPAPAPTESVSPNPPKAEKLTPSCSALKPLQPLNVKLFKFSLEIQRALNLPLNSSLKAKKSGKQRNTSKRFPPNEPPSTYVTFQADEGHYQKYKSHEGMVFATNIVEKSTQPQWQQRFRLAATMDYLNNPLKRFILKVWKKSAVDMSQGRNVPTPMEDAIIGFAAVDLTVFLRGLHIGGRFNIVDFNGRINGQLEIRCQPLEDMPAPRAAEELPSNSSVDSVIDQFEQTLDLTHLNLGQAIKRKFTELEGISQRLRARLGDVTGTELARDFDMEQFKDWKPLDNELKDLDDLDEFEKDLNTPTEEEKPQGSGESAKQHPDE